MRKQAWCVVVAMIACGCGFQSFSDLEGAPSGSGGADLMGGVGGGVSGSGSVGGFGGVGGAGGVGGGGRCEVDNDTPINRSCPSTSPTTGECAMRGACCFRSSNARRARRAWEAGQTATLEFRLSAQRTVSQPTTLGLPVIQSSLINSYDNEWNVTLVRISGVPREGRAQVMLEVGPGRANCDGTYSFFGSIAAPPLQGRSLTYRWETVALFATWDWSSDTKLSVGEGAGRSLLWFPVARGHGEFGWEEPLQQQTFALTFDASSGDEISDEALDCLGGELLTASQWSANMNVTSFMPVVAAMQATIDSTAISQNLCSFIALGFMNPSPCQDVPQSQWMEMPTGMCNELGCYVGDASDAEARCGSDEAPCCDPTGFNGLWPACNAFHLRSFGVLSGAAITDEPHNDSAHPFADCTNE